MVFFNVCRCCLTEACFKDISNEYVQGGCREVYSHMLLDTFSIEISYQNTDSRLICEDCVLRLRDAAAFKKQILQVEDIITKRIADGVLKNDDIKPLDEYDDFIDYIIGEFEDESVTSGNENEQHFFDDDNFHWDDDGFNKECGDENKFLVKQDPEEDVPLQLLQRNNSCKKTARKNIVKNENLKRKAANSKKEPKKKKVALQRRIKNRPQFDRKENSLKLITHSNLCLFESQKTKFRCFFCKNSYFTIAELREHTLTHTDEKYKKICVNRLQGMSFKCADISNLTCKICSEAVNDLTELKSHLTTHDIQFSGEENMLIQYKLDKGFQCVMCEDKFHTFFKLSVHMNSHYTNHVCEICGSSYINRLSLRMHVNSRHKETKCSLCPVTFNNAYLRAKHMRKMHNCSESKRYCLICNKTFRYTYMLEEHKIQEHGKKRTISVCGECGKSFLSPVNLRTHVRCVHIKVNCKKPAKCKSDSRTKGSVPS